MDPEPEVGGAGIWAGGVGVRFGSHCSETIQGFPIPGCPIPDFPSLGRHVSHIASYMGLSLAHLPFFYV